MARTGAQIVSALVGVAFLFVAVAAIVLARSYGLVAPISQIPGANPVAGTPTDRLAIAADGLAAAMETGGSGLTFEVVQLNTLYAKAGGPQIELTDPSDQTKVIGLVDQRYVNSIITHGGMTGDAFWMELRGSLDPKADFASAEFFARVLERDGRLWRDDGVGWYQTDESPGVGIDPTTARLLPSLLNSLGGATALEPKQVDGWSLTGIRGLSTPAAYPGVIAADGADFTDKTFQVDCWFDEQGRLVRLEARARNLNQTTYDLISETVVTFSYGAPGDPPDPSPTMAPEVPPTSEPEAAEVQS